MSKRDDARGSVSSIKGATRRDDTTLRLGGVGDNWHMSWAADGRQYVSMCDGFGWSDPPGPYYTTRLMAISGGPTAARFKELAGYPELSCDLGDPETWNRYYGFGTLALDGRIYQFLSTPDAAFDKLNVADPRFVGAKLIYSPDNGRTWCNQDGSTPVVWESWEERSRETMIFFEESQQALSLLSVLQMGRNYEANEDGYVYVCAPNGNTDGTMNELVMFRVRKEQILARSAYEFFQSLTPDGGATWTKDIDGRGVVHTFPHGWVNTSIHPYAWHPSIAYNKPLGLYMMANWGMGCTPDGAWFGKPSYLGLWVANSPWGPWTQVHEETAWTPEGDDAARAYQPQISPKWIAEDGRSFWLVWTDYQDTSGEGLLPALETWSEPEERKKVLEQSSVSMPYYGFNAQRVELTT